MNVGHACEPEVLLRPLLLKQEHLHALENFFLYFHCSGLFLQVFQVQREALFNKSERQVAEAQLLTVQQQLSDLQAQSTHIQQLHQEIQESQGLIKEKDRKVRVKPKDNILNKGFR